MVSFQSAYLRVHYTAEFIERIKRLGVSAENTPAGVMEE
jgi:DNA polymerase III alpha subunit